MALLFVVKRAITEYCVTFSADCELIGGVSAFLVGRIDWRCYRRQTSVESVSVDVGWYESSGRYPFFWVSSVGLEFFLTCLSP